MTDQPDIEGVEDTCSTLQVIERSLYEMVKEERQ